MRAMAFTFTPTVLVIDDEPHIRRFVRAALEAEGCEVFEADRVQRGLIEAGTRQPDAVILDLGLPDGDGMSLIRDLRTWTEVPVLVLSARVDERDKIDALDAGADDYLTKPFGVGELIARLRVLLRRHAKRGEDGGSIIAFGDVQVDLARRLVSRNGEPVHLTPIEYRLLSVLLGPARRGDDPPRAAARSLGPRAFGQQPLPAHLHGPPAPQAGARSGAPAAPADRSRRRLPLRRLSVTAP